MGKGRISHFEARLERLVEGSFARLFGGPLHPRDVALQLARAIEDHTRTDEENREVAPNFYRVRLHPDDHTTLLKHTTGLEKQLAQHVAAVCVDAGLFCPTIPRSS